MRILLVQPDQEQTMGLQQAARLEPLGLEMVAGALRGRHDVSLLDLRLNPYGLGPALRSFRPDMVGISSSFTVDTAKALQIAQFAKEEDERTFVFVGGHHATLRPVDFHHSAVDAIVLGEGEITTREMADCLQAGQDLRLVPGLIINSDKVQIYSPQRMPVKDLDFLPWPDRNLTRAYRREYHMVLKSPVASVETARGCPYRCRFCSVWLFYQKQVRYKSAHRVVEELASVNENRIFFTDDNFLCDAARAEEIARLIRQRGIRKNYLMQIRSDAVVRHADVVALWREIGLDSVFIGFEKPDQAGLESMAKHSSVEDNEKALAILRRLHIEPTVSFIVDPGWERKDFEALQEYVRKLKLRYVMFTVLTPLPGTDLFEEAKDHLISVDYELFDLCHALVPTRLPTMEFYQEMARLWRNVYPRWRLRLLQIYLWLRMIWSRSPRDLGARALAEAYRLADARNYLKPCAPVRSRA